MKVQASVKDQSLDAQTEQEKDMIYSIVDFLAKRSLMKKKGSDELWRYVVNDEMRWGPAPKANQRFWSRFLQERILLAEHIFPSLFLLASTP